MKKYYITTPIYYVNDLPHLGHAYSTIAADVIARHFRTKKYKVMFLTGTDEHGKKVAQAAKEAKLPAEKFTDKISKQFKKTWKNLNISYDRFIRTTNLEHIETVQKILQKLKDKGLVFKGKYSGLYCSGCEAYKTKKDLVNGKCPEHDIKPEKNHRELLDF